MAHDYCICGAGRVSCIDCAEAAIDSLTAQLAEAKQELKRQTEIVEDAEQSYFRIVDKYNSRADQILQLQTENATLREEVEKYKCLDGFKQLREEARKQTAQEIVEMLRADRWAESELKEIIEKFGLEG